MLTNVWTGADTTKDNGSCCGARATFTKNMTYAIGGTAKAIQASAAAPSSGNDLIYQNGYACAAFSNKQEYTSGAYTVKMDVQALDNTATYNASLTSAHTAYWSWWCSNGLYNKIADNANPTPQWAPNIKQALPDNANQRYELALAGCPQLKSVCGAAALTDVDSAGSSGTAISVNKAVMTTSEKCTFVGYGVTNPPAFTIDIATGSTGSKTTGLLAASAWTVHHMEYNNTQLAEQAAIEY